MTDEYTIGPDVDLEREDIRDSQGRRVDDAYVDRTIQDARRGRPSLSGGQSRSPSVSFRLTDDVRQRARQRAEREGVTVSQLARQALERYLADS